MQNNKRGNIIKIVGIVLGVIALFVLVFVSSNMRDNGSETKEPIIVNTTVNEYFNLKKGEESVVILFASPNCQWCTKYKPIINKISSDYELPIYYVDTSVMTRDEYMEVVNDSPYMTREGGFGTPLTLIVGNNEEIAALEGKVEYDEVKDLLKENGIIK